jgi:3-hydroxyacyl-CoA dehydrogenase/enoyl-CoA hydratase/3-hydroxybutyryl-CoA epimerase
MTATAAPLGTATNAFRLEHENELSILYFDLPGEKVNKFSSAVMTEFNALIDQLATTSEVKRLLVVSKKPGIFIAGADVSEFGKVTSAEQAEEYTRFGQQTFLKFAKLPQITAALIDGACLGGGTELALNCDYRIATDNLKTTIGLPEVKLGIFPAWTGTSKLPRLIGIPAALDMILTGKTFDGKRAQRIGLVDEVVPGPIALEAAKSFLSKQKSKRRSGSANTHFYVEGNPLARKVIFNKARQSVLEKTGGHYPAPLKAIEVMELGYSKSLAEGLAAEPREASQLILGDVAQNLVRLFFMMEDAKKDSGPAPAAVKKVGVLGAGVMGGGIAQIVVDKADIPVRMKDINWGALAGGMKAAARLWKRKVDSRRMKRNEMQRRMSMITTSTDWSGFSDTDVVIEAVVENLGIKQQVLAEYEGTARPDAIFATNTSTIPITQIAARAQRPDRVVGMHFFNPVDRMPLVEVIAGEKTSAATMSTIASLSRKLGKTVVICKDGPGFVVNRILAPYMNEAALLLEEGNSIDAIDKAMTGFGMPMGPLALLDEVGIDVANKAAHVLAEAFAGRMTEPKSLARLLEDKRLGKKNGRGVYLWKEGKRVGADSAIYKLVGVKPQAQTPPEKLVERMVLAMINEASRVLGDRIVASAPELDLAMIMGTGFPPFRGGLMRYADSLGLPYIAARLDELQASAGARFAPSEVIRDLAAKSSSFYQGFPRK